MCLFKLDFWKEFKTRHFSILDVSPNMDMSSFVVVSSSFQFVKQYSLKQTRFQILNFAIIL